MKLIQNIETKVAQITTILCSILNHNRPNEPCFIWCQTTTNKKKPTNSLCTKSLGLYSSRVTFLQLHCPTASPTFSAHINVDPQVLVHFKNFKVITPLLLCRYRYSILIQVYIWRVCTWNYVCAHRDLLPIAGSYLGEGEDKNSARIPFDCRYVFFRSKVLSIFHADRIVSFRYIRSKQKLVGKVN